MKVRIYQDQIVPDSPGIFVLSPTGDYAPFDLIECYAAGMPKTSYCAYQAQFVKFGGVVYRETEYAELLKRLGVVDAKPETLNDLLIKDESTIVIDNILDQQATDVAATDTTTIIEDEKYSTTTDAIIPDDTKSETTEADKLINETIIQPNSTSTVATSTNANNATSTQPMQNATSTNPLEQFINDLTGNNTTTTSALTNNNATTTQSIIEPLVNGTSTNATSSDIISSIVDQVIQEIASTSSANSTQVLPSASSTIIESVSSSAETVINSTSTGI